MSRARVFGLAFVLCAALPSLAAAQATPSDVPRVQRFVLDNGLTVVLEEDHSRPRVGVAIRYDVGSMDDPPGHPGLAHLVEHLMFSAIDPGTSDDSYKAWLARIGVQAFQGETGPRHSVFYELVPSAQLDRLLWGESRRMALLLAYVHEARVEKERIVAFHEEQLRGLDRNCDQSGLLAERLIYGPGQQAASDVAHSVTDVQWFFQHWYRPERARLALVGDFQSDLVRALITKYFGTIKAIGPSGARAPLAEQAVLPHTIDVGTSVPEPKLTLICAMPTSNPVDLAALHVLTHELDRRLEKSLIDQAMLATHIQTSLFIESNVAVLSTTAMLAGGAGHRAALDHMSDVSLVLGQVPISAGRFERLRDGQRLAYLESLSRFEARAKAWAVDDSAADDTYQALQQLTPETVRALAARYLTAQRCHVVQVFYEPNAVRRCRVDDD